MENMPQGYPKLDFADGMGGEVKPRCWQLLVIDSKPCKRFPGPQRNNKPDKKYI
ncbi:hypothetical protein I7I53_02155 [Histoplasma capsulatum var. duboisii H88]|uniref:Uncharacterized protein n=2 Tax=Ajellomyces capsulatus (strain H88) TaxID=544711 RepID=A0A8A1LRE3_AJEC8|nr:hypothetical protein I7I53_02155 [Histoplasma capsulatum var. duboisii H88]